jgi:hypothetical protein
LGRRGFQAGVRHVAAELDVAACAGHVAQVVAAVANQAETSGHALERAREELHLEARQAVGREVLANLFERRTVAGVGGGQDGVEAALWQLEGDAGGGARLGHDDDRPVRRRRLGFHDGGQLGEVQPLAQLTRDPAFADFLPDLS